MPDADTGTVRYVDNGTERYVDTPWMRFVNGLRATHGRLSMGEFMRRIGTSAGTGTRWLQGQVTIRPATALRIAREFGVALQEVQIAAGYGTPADYDWHKTNSSTASQIAYLTNQQLLDTLASRLPPDPEPEDETGPRGATAPDVRRRKTREDDE